MLKIRLRRVGRRHQPHFYIVVTEHSSPVKGKYIEKLGFYNPDQNIFLAEKDRIVYWLSRGAQASVTVYNLLVKHKVIKGKPITKSVKPNKKEEEEQEETKAETETKQEDKKETEGQDAGQPKEVAEKEKENKEEEKSE